MAQSYHGEGEERDSLLLVEAIRRNNEALGRAGLHLAANGDRYSLDNYSVLPVLQEKEGHQRRRAVESGPCSGVLFECSC